MNNLIYDVLCYNFRERKGVRKLSSNEAKKDEMYKFNAFVELIHSIHRPWLNNRKCHLIIFR